MLTQYDVVNEDDQLIGVQDRETIHKQDLIHREVRVCFIMPQKEAIFQKRASIMSQYLLYSFDII